MLAKSRKRLTFVHTIDSEIGADFLFSKAFGGKSYEL